jgi:hypothetical protein
LRELFFCRDELTLSTLDFQLTPLDLGGLIYDASSHARDATAGTIRLRLDVNITTD